MNKSKRIGRQLLCLIIAFVMVLTLIPRMPGGLAYAEENLLEESFADGETPEAAVPAEAEQTQPLETISEHFKATVTYGPEAGIPEGAYLVLTEYAEGSPEFEEAKAALVADEEGNSVYSQTSEEEQENLGMAAFDLTIYDAEGNVVEPAEEVAVNIEVVAFPEGASADALAETMEIQHLNESTGEIVVEKVATVDSEEAAEVESVSEIAVDTEQATAAVEFAVDGFSTFVFTWTDDTLREHVIVHYVDVNGNEIQGTQTANVNVSGTVTFSTYEGGISGYTFKEARLDDPMGGKLVTGFTPSSSGNTLTFTNNGTNVESFTRPYNKEVYFIYTPNDAPGGGDVPSIGKPATEKILERQNDGTYDITLKIKGEAASTTTETRANIIVVYDSSNSMSETDTTTVYTEDENGMWGQLDNGEYVQLRQGNIWYLNGNQYNGYRYLAGTGNNYDRGIYNGNVVQLYRNGSRWYRSRAGNYYYNEYTGTRYNRVDNDDSDTTHNLGFDSATGQMVQLTRESALVYGTGSGTTIYTGEKRYSAQSTTQSRHEIAKAAVTSLANQLFEFNKDNPQMIQMALVDFGTMVNSVNGASFTLSGSTLTPTASPTNNKTTFLNWLDGIIIPNASDTDSVPSNLGGTDWEEALKVANLINFGDTDPTYVIFVSDGAPTYRVSQNGHNNDGSASRTSNGRTVTVYGSGNSDPNDYNLDAAVVEAKNILARNKELYTVGAFVVDNNRLPNLGGNDYDASDSDKLNQAFSDIVDSITNALNIANVNITDGLTALTASTFVSGDIDESTFRYTKGGEVWAPQADGAENATVVTDANGNQSVQWAMGENYLLEKNVEYTVTFTVWPKQEAYDILAALNNDVLEWGEDYTYQDAEGNTVTIPAEDTDGVKGYKSQIVKNGDVYTVMTNTSAGATYQEVSFVDGKEVGRTDGSVGIDNPTEGMGLSESHLDVTKQWNDSLDPSQLLDLLTDNLVQNDDGTYTCKYNVQLEITNNGVDYVPVIIKPEVVVENGKVVSATWPTQKVFIAPGVMLSEAKATEKGIDSEKYTHVTYNGTTYLVLESGHDYSVRELGGDYHFELRAKTYHPMVVDGQVMDVEFIYDGDEITGIEAMDTQNTGVIVAVNELRAGINLRKIITNSDNEEIFPENDDFYVVKVNLKDADGNAIKFSDYSGNNSVKYFNEDGTTSTAQVNWDTYPIWFNVYYDAKDDLDLEGTYERSEGMIVEDGGYIILKAGEVVRLANVPIGTQFSFAEVEGDIPEDIEFVEYNYKEGKGTDTWTTETDIDEGYSDTAIGNQSYYMTITNQMDTDATVDLEGEKSWVGDTAANRPASVTVKVMQHVEGDDTEAGEPNWTQVQGAKGTATITPNDNGEWKYLVEDLPKYTSEGTKISYKVDEVVVTGYTTTYADVTQTTDEDGNVTFVANLTNTRDKGYLKVTKEMGEDSDLDDIKYLPDDAVFTISGPKDYGTNGSKTVTGADIKAGYSEEVPTGEYSVAETGADVTGYTLVTTYDPTTAKANVTEENTEQAPAEVKVINTYTVIPTNVEATKKWEDNSDQDGARPANVVFALYKTPAGGTETAVLDATGQPVTATLTGTGDTWTTQFTDLPSYEDGKALTYTIKEMNGENAVADGGTLPGKKEGTSYTAAYSADKLTVTNSYTPEEVSVPVEKKWEDADDQDGIRPTSVTVNLLADNTKIKDATIKVGEDGKWTYIFTKLPKYKEGGTAIVYTVEEVRDESVITGTDGPGTYADTVTGSVENGFTVTNKHTPETVDINGQKEWPESEFEEAREEGSLTRPEEITVILYSVETVDGEEVKTEVDSTTAKAEDNWAFSFEDLPKYKVGAVGQLVVYKVEEVPVDGFEPVYTTDDEGIQVITNTPIDEEEVLNPLDLVIKKTDANTGNVIGTGAEFELVGPTASEKVTVKTGADGTYKITFTKDGTYTLTETKAPNGYQLTDPAPSYTIVVEKDFVEVKLNEEKTVWQWIYDLIFSRETEAQFDNGVLTVPNPPVPTNVTATKKWNDQSDKDGTRPENVVFALYKTPAGGTETAVLDATGQPVTATLTGTGDTWTTQFTDLPSYEDGKALTYTIKEMNGGNAVADGGTLPGKNEGDEYVASYSADKLTVTNSIQTVPEKTAFVNETTHIVNGEVVAAGSNVTYQIDYTNTTGQTSDEIIITDKIPAYTEYVSSTENGEFADGTVTWTFTNVPDGTHLTVKVTVKVEEDASGVVLENTGVVKDGEHDPVSTNTTSNPTSVDVSFPVQKIMEVPEYLDGPESWSYRIDVTPSEGAPVAATMTGTVTNEKDTVTFGKFTYTAPGEYVYSVSETGTISGVQNDAEAAGKTVTVTVSQDPDTKALSAVATSTTTAPLKFTNKYDTPPVPVETSAYLSKTVDKMQPGVDSVTFDFTIAAVTEGAPLPQKEDADNTSASVEFTKAETKAIDFGTITFDKPGTYEYTLTEVLDDLDGGWVVTGNGATVTVIVVDNKEGALIATVTGAVIKNTFDTTTVNGEKKWNDEEYFDENGEPIEGYERPDITVNLLADGQKIDSVVTTAADNWKYSFTDLPKYKDHGTEIVYTVTEEAVPAFEGEVDGYDIENTPKRLDEDQLNPTELTIKKVDAETGNVIPTGATFVLKKGETEIEYTTGEDGTVVIPFAQGGNEDGTYTLYEKKAPEGYTASDKTYTIVVDKEFDHVEIKENLWTWFYNLIFGDKTKAEFDEDTQTLTVENPPVKVKVEATKVWNDNNDKDKKRPDSITLTLTGTTGDKEVFTDTKTVTAKDSWKTAWTDLASYVDGEEVVFELTEAAIAGYTTDEIKVVKGEDGNYTVTVKNNHQSEPLKEVFSGSSTTNIDGQVVEPGQELTYKITYVNTTGATAETVTITDKIPEFTEFVSADNGGTEKDGTVTWTMSNVADEKEIVVQFVVKVKDDVNGQAVKNKAVVNDGTNDYETNEVVNRTPVKHDPPVKKIVKGEGADPNDEFKFSIEALYNTAGVSQMPMPNDASGKIAYTTAKAGETKEFGWITFTEPGTYVYEVKEVNNGLKNYKYDSTSYKLTYELASNDGDLKMTLTVTRNGAKYDHSAFEFENVYEPPVKTGDTTIIGEYVVIFFASIVLLLMILFRRRRAEEK